MNEFVQILSWRRSRELLLVFVTFQVKENVSNESSAPSWIPEDEGKCLEFVVLGIEQKFEVECKC